MFWQPMHLGCANTKYPLVGQCYMHNIDHQHFPNGALNPKTTNQKTNGICDLKPKMKIKLNMASLLEFTNYESFLFHGIT
jgi:hypothetical protein